MVHELAGNVYDLPSTETVIRYHHASLGFPVKSTFLKAVKHGNLLSFPGLTTNAINDYFPKSDETQKGHMKQQRQNLRSTKEKEDNDKENELDMKRPIECKRDVYVKVYDPTKRPMYTDQTGKFPVTSSRGQMDVMVAVEMDGHYIDAEPLKSGSIKDLIKAYQAVWKRWEATGVTSPNWHALDNEAPADYKEAIRKNGCTVELTPPDIHRRNIAERVIQTWKDHFISVLAGVDAKFPLHE